jgi:hypothetical protein
MAKKVAVLALLAVLVFFSNQNEANSGKAQVLSALLVIDAFPWQYDIVSFLSNTIFRRTGLEVINSRKLKDIELSKYCPVIFVSDQPPEFYDNVEEALDKIEAYLRFGGVLHFNAAYGGWNGGLLGTFLPGGVLSTLSYSRKNNVVIPPQVSPPLPIRYSLLFRVFTDIIDSLSANYVSHVYFTQLPKYTGIVTVDNSGKPTTVFYNLGLGEVIATGLTLEWAIKYNLAYRDVFLRMLALELDLCRELKIPEKGVDMQIDGIRPSKDAQGNIHLVLDDSLAGRRIYVKMSVACFEGTLPLDDTIGLSVYTLDNKYIPDAGGALSKQRDGSFAGWFEVPKSREGRKFILKVSFTCGSTRNPRYTIENIGFLELIDPSGFVFEDRNGNGQFESNEQKLAGAVVTLEVFIKGRWIEVNPFPAQEWEGISKWPGIEPQVNPQLTGPNGHYGWDVPAGEYRVRVEHRNKIEKIDYERAVSHSVKVPPPVTNLNVGLIPIFKCNFVDLENHGRAETSIDLMYFSPPNIFCLVVKLQPDHNLYVQILSKDTRDVWNVEIYEGETLILSQKVGRGDIVKAKTIMGKAIVKIKGIDVWPYQPPVKVYLWSD